MVAVVLVLVSSPLLRSARSKISLSETVLTTPNKSFMVIAHEVSRENDYEANGYNCWDYATDLVAELRNNGYIAEIVIGEANCSEECGWDTCPNAHAWVELMIPIEASSGEIIPAEKYDKCYKFGYYGVPKIRTKND